MASWRLLGGPSSSSQAPVGTVPSTGFETSIPITGAFAYMSVQALGASGEVLGGSAPVAR